MTVHRKTQILLLLVLLALGGCGSSGSGANAEQMYFGNQRPASEVAILKEHDWVLVRQIDLMEPQSRPVRLGPAAVRQFHVLPGEHVVLIAMSGREAIVNVGADITASAEVLLSFVAHAGHTYHFKSNETAWAYGPGFYKPGTWEPQIIDEATGEVVSRPK